MRKIIILSSCLICSEIYAQKSGLDIFARLPQVVNYNFNNRNISYTPVISAGVTLRYGAFFADVGSFIDKADVFGHYVYFGSPLHIHRYQNNKLFLLNWFGEVNRIPDQGETEAVTIKTIGVSPVMVWVVGKSAFAIAYTFGVAFSNGTMNLNSRIILNYALPLLN